MTKTDLDMNQHYLSPEELEKLYSDVPEALENNYNFHLRFNFKPKIKANSTSISSNESKSAEEELSKLAKKVKKD